MATKIRILIGYDGSDCAEAAVADLRRAGLPADAEAVVMTAVDLTPHLPPSCYQPADPATIAREPQILRNARTLALSAMAEARATAARGVDRVRAEFPQWQVHPETTPDYSPYRALVVKADKWRPDLLVVGSHGRSAAGRAFLGSVSQQVLSHAICSVRVARFREDAGRIAGDPVRVVLGIDGSVDSAAAADVVAKRAWPKGTEVRVVFAADAHVAVAFLYAPPFGIWGPGFEPAREERSPATSLVEAVARRVREAGFIASPFVREGDPKQVLVREAEAFNADCVFVGAKGHSRLDRFLLGSVSSAIANRAPCSVEVVRQPSRRHAGRAKGVTAMTVQQQMPVFRRILVAVDRTIASRWATRMAAQLAAETGARVALMHVLDISRGFSPEFGFVDETAVERLRPFGEELLDRAAASVLEAGVPVDRIVHEGDPPNEIVAAADRWGADLIVMGTHGHGRLARLLLGSTAETVVRSAHCPVLTVGHEPTAAEATRERVGAVVTAGESALA